MKSSLRVLMCGLITITLASCDSARMSQVNAKTKTTPDNRKIDCTKMIQTVGVYDFDRRMIATLTPWIGALTAAANYNYQNLSANPILGPQGHPSATTHFVYQNSEGMFLNLIFDKQYDEGERATVTTHLQISGNQMRDSVTLSDEAGEMKLVDFDEGLQVTYYEGNYEYSKHSDGAVIGPLIGNSWEIRVQHISANRIESLQFVDELMGVKSFARAEKSVSDLMLKPLTMNACDL